MGSVWRVRARIKAPWGPWVSLGTSQTSVSLARSLSLALQNEADPLSRGRVLTAPQSPLLGRQLPDESQLGPRVETQPGPTVILGGPSSQEGLAWAGQGWEGLHQGEDQKRKLTLPLSQLLSGP